VKALLPKTQSGAKILRWIGSIGAFILLVILLKNQGWADIRNALLEVSLVHFCLCILLIFGSRFAVVGRWYALLSAVEDFSFWESIRITFAGLFASNFLPTTIGGDVVRFAGTVQLKFDTVQSAASLIVDRLIGMFGMALALPFGARYLFVWFATDQATQTSMVMHSLFAWSSKLWAKGVDLLRNIYQDVLIWGKHPKSLLLSFVFTGIHMLCIFCIINLLLDDLGEHLNLWLVGGLWSFVYFVTLLPISINGYGVQEISMAFIFSEVGGISLQSGLTASILFRALMLLGSIPGVFFISRIIAGIRANDHQHK
jgi:uncharacterized membrane protein YbhN (UPF0104 family)